MHGTTAGESVLCTHLHRSSVLLEERHHVLVRASLLQSLESSLVQKLFRCSGRLFSQVSMLVVFFLYSVTTWIPCHILRVFLLKQRLSSFWECALFVALMAFCSSYQDFLQSLLSPNPNASHLLLMSLRMSELKPKLLIQINVHSSGRDADEGAPPDD